jgi:death on curing protein
MPVIYIPIDLALEIHEKTIAVSGGGEYGVLNQGQLESILEHIQNDDYYPTIVDKLTHLFHSVCTFHTFVDGNKRLAITLSSQMLLLNGYLRSIDHFIREAENISYHTAAGRIDKDLVGEWMQAILTGHENDESLKLKILEAISNHDDEITH